jgi:hypothetical protein
VGDDKSPYPLDSLADPAPASQDRPLFLKMFDFKVWVAFRHHYDGYRLVVLFADVWLLCRDAGQG